jgi:hypothetical protein
MENHSQGSGAVRDYTLRRLGCLLRDSLGRPAERQCTSVTRDGLQSALGGHKFLPRCRTKGIPVSSNFGPNVPSCSSRNAKTLGL